MNKAQTAEKILHEMRAIVDQQLPTASVAVKLQLETAIAHAEQLAAAVVCGVRLQPSYKSVHSVAHKLFIDVASICNLTTESPWADWAINDEEHEPKECSESMLSMFNAFFKPCMYL